MLFQMFIFDVATYDPPCLVVGKTVGALKLQTGYVVRLDMPKDVRLMVGHFLARSALPKVFWPLVRDDYLFRNMSSKDVENGLIWKRKKSVGQEENPNLFQDNKHVLKLLRAGLSIGTHYTKLSCWLCFIADGGEETA